MTSPLSRLMRMVMLALMLGLALARPASAAEEKEGPSALRDSETELLFRDISAPLVRAAKLDPRNVRVILLNDREINAFVAGTQDVYVNSGLILASDNVNQLQGVIAHELGHVAGGHAIRVSQGAGEATGISIATMVLGAIAIAAGAGDAGMGLMMMGQRAALGRFLAFTRAQESTADLAGAGYLAAAGISGKGSLEFFKKLQNQEYRLAIYATDSYDRTHPLSSERISMLEGAYTKDPAWDRPPDPALEARFQRIKAKLLGFLDPKQAVIKYPESDQSVPAHYARAYAYHIGAYPEKALSEAGKLLAIAPQDPFFLELKGQILLESGRPAEAVNRDNENPFAWYQLGIIYDREGDPARAALATAERNNLQGNPKLALASAEMAMKGIPAGSPDYLRAQDIAMVSKAEIKKDKGKKKRD